MLTVVRFGRPRRGGIEVVIIPPCESSPDGAGLGGLLGPVPSFVCIKTWHMRYVILCYIKLY